MHKKRNLAVTATVFALLLAIYAEPSNARGVRKAISKELTERIAIRSGVRGTEREALMRTLRQLDATALQRLEARYGTYIPQEVLAGAKRRPSTFLNEADYQRWLARAYPNATKQELRDVVGDTHPITNGVTVNRNQANLVRTLAHERTHQLSHPRFRKSFGRDFDEGTTDYFAARVTKDLRLTDDVVGYPAERDLPRMIAARVGEAPLARAYFRGEFDDLAAALERELGPRSFATLQRHLRNGDIASARSMLLARNAR